jgi:hypothetical protein
MMTTGRGPSGGETFSLHPTGWGRYIEVVFLAVWLAGWLVGECVMVIVFGGMLAGMFAAAFGITLSFASRMTPDGSAPFFVLFMLVFLTLWTIGGIAAGTAFLRTLAGRDSVSVSPAGLELEWRAGPFRRRRTLAHGTIHRVRIGLKNEPVIADTASGSVDITDLGTPDERRALHDWLHKHLVLPDEAEARRLDAEVAPPGWEVEVEGMEARLSWPARRYRRFQAGILWAVAAMLFTGCLPAFLPLDPDGMLGSPRPGADPTPLYIGAGILSLLVAMWATWTMWGRAEWVAIPGRLTRRRRFASWQSAGQSFENATLDLRHTFDSDGDDRFELRIRNETTHRRIASSLHDEADEVRLAEWLSARTRFPIDRLKE